MKTVITLKKELPGTKIGTIGTSTLEDPELYHFGSGRHQQFYSGYIRNNPGFFDIKTVYEPEDVKEGQYRQDGEDNLLTTPEIEAALIKEAERRYGKSAEIATIPEANEGYDKDVVGFPFDYYYDKERDALLSGVTIVYYKGIWAEIIEEKKEESPIPEMIKENGFSHLIEVEEQMLDNPGRISERDIWETPSRNFALTAKAMDKVEAAVNHYEALMKDKYRFEDKINSREQILNEFMSVLFDYYEFAVKVHAVFKESIPKGLQKQLNDLINTINEDAEKEA